MAVQWEAGRQSVGLLEYRTEKRPALLIRKTRVRALAVCMVCVGFIEVAHVLYTGLDFVEDDGSVTRGVLDGVNDLAIRWLKTVGKYRPEFGNEVADRAVILHMTL